MSRKELAMVVRTASLVAFMTIGLVHNARSEVAGCVASRSSKVIGAPRESLIPDGYLHTAGNQILDRTNLPVRIASVGWFTGYGEPESQVKKIVEAGFNAVRIPWYNATMESNLAVVDTIVSAASTVGLKVILDHHGDEAPTEKNGWGSQQANGLPFDLGPGTNDTDGMGDPGTVTRQRFVQDWQTIGGRYAGNSTVIGFDLHNEPLAYRGQSTWGDGSVTDIKRIYEEAGDAIHRANPDVLIIAEGPQNYRTNFAGTARAPYGDLSIAAQKPVTLAVPNKVVYSVHSYPSLQSNFKETDNGPRAIARMNADFGYLVAKNIAPVWIGEMGASMDTPAERAWALTLVDYLNGKNAELGGPSFSGKQQAMGSNWWAWGNLSGQFPNGTLEDNGSLRETQRQFYAQLRQMPSCGGE
jgi:endoglucanase/chitinase